MKKIRQRKLERKSAFNPLFDYGNAEHPVSESEEESPEIKKTGSKRSKRKSQRKSTRRGTQRGSQFQHMAQMSSNRHPSAHRTPQMHPNNRYQFDYYSQNSQSQGLHHGGSQFNSNAFSNQQNQPGLVYSSQQSQQLQHSSQHGGLQQSVVPVPVNA